MMWMISGTLAGGFLLLWLLGGGFALGADAVQKDGGGFVGGVFDGGDVLAEGLFFDLDDADGLARAEGKDVVGGAGVGLIFADRLALAVVEVDGVFVLAGPAGGAELRVDLIASDLFGLLIRRHDQEIEGAVALAKER